MALIVTPLTVMFRSQGLVAAEGLAGVFMTRTVFEKEMIEAWAPQIVTEVYKRLFMGNPDPVMLKA